MELWLIFKIVGVRLGSVVCTWVGGYVVVRFVIFFEGGVCVVVWGDVVVWVVCGLGVCCVGCVVVVSGWCSLHA